MEIFVHDTAFMIAQYRAQQENISKDPYAHLWLRPSVKKWTDDFAKQVSKDDEILHCLRNRFFYETLSEIAKTEEKVLFINLGAGFSMYPFVLPKHLKTIEVDFEEITTYKKQKLASFFTSKQLPKRTVQLVAANITQKNGQETLKKALEDYKDYKKVILIEGVFFFLTKQQIDSIFQFCRRLLQPEDIVMCVSYQDTIEQTQVFQRLKRYFSEVLKSDGNPYTTLPHSFYKNLEGFNLIKQDSELEFGKNLGVISNTILEKNVLNEYFYVLKKK